MICNHCRKHKDLFLYSFDKSFPENDWEVRIKSERQKNERTQYIDIIKGLDKEQRYSFCTPLKVLLKSFHGKKSWQRQRKDYVETCGGISKTLYRQQKDKPRTSRGQKQDLQRVAPTKSTTLPIIQMMKLNKNADFTTTYIILYARFY